MPNQLTAGFDITGQIGQETIENIFRAYYESGTFPSHVKQPYQSSQGDTSGIMFRLTVNGPNTVANEPYQTSVTWLAESLAPDEQNTCGNTDPINITKTYSGNRNVSGDYTIEQPATQERPGLWNFTVNALGSSSTCNKTLTPGNTKLVGFTHQQTGCQ